MSNYSALRRPLSERLPIVTYTNRYTPVAETLWMSPQVERLTGYPLRDWVGRPGFIETVLHPDDRGPVLAEMRASREEARAFSRDYRLLRPDGRVVWLHDESVPIVDDAGEPELIQGYLVDITERKELERQLLHAQKLGALGRVAAGIAHDFNNFLTAIGGYASLAVRALPEGSPARRYLAELVRTVESATRLARQLVTFSRAEAPAPRPVDVTATIRELQPMLRPIAGDWVRLELDLKPTPKVYADLSQVEQLVVNLVANARDANAGSITIRTDTVDEDALLTVTDDGDGMDEETRDRALEPFFTTKDAAHGSGLGLSIVEGIVDRAGGSLEVESAPGAGTRMAIRLPSAPLG